MIIYLYLFIPSLFLSVESSSIRGRNNKNELVPVMSSGVDTPGKNNNLKVVSSEPFIIQLHVPKHNDSKSTREMDKKRKRPSKKRVSKLRKKHRTRRDLITSRLTKRSREEKSQPTTEIPIAVNGTEAHLKKNATNNSITRVEILKALSASYSGKNQTKITDADDTGRTHPSLGKNPIVKMIYPSTPKLDRHSHKYTYKDLMADRKRLEQKINYIKNMFTANDSATTDDAVRIRRRTESDRTANKIAKMFLTLSAVNGLHDRRRTRCKDDYDDDDDDGDRVQYIWEKEQRDSPNRKTSSSNAERYKVKKWIEFMKNKRSSSKTCPCMAALQSDDSDAFPLERKLPKDYFLMERSRSSEESSETYRDPSYHPRQQDRSNRRKYNKETPENKLKALGKTGKKKLDLPLTDLEVYRSRAKQILQNAEEILDKIKEEEERRLSAPSILMSQLKELTSRIQSDPRNNENDLIRKMQKSLGWTPLAKGKEASDGNTFIDNVKSYILDPYEKAKALTDESAKTLSSYLLRNLGKMSSEEEQETQKQSDDETGDRNDNPQVFYGQVPTKEDEKPLPASLAKEGSQPDLLAKSKQELQNWEDTISTIMQGPEETVRKYTPEEVFKNRMEDIIKEQQKKLQEAQFEENREADGEDNRNPNGKKTKPGVKITKPEKHPLRLKPKDGTDKDKLKNLNHLKGVSKVSKPEKDTLGGDKFRLKSKDGNEAGKQVGNHKKHPAHGHLKTGRKPALPKASAVEDPEVTASKETEELGKEILEEIAKTLENDDSVGEQRETADPGETLETVGEEPKLQMEEDEEVGNPNETHQQRAPDEERHFEDESAAQDGNWGETVSGKLKTGNDGQEFPGTHHQPDREALNVNSPASRYPPDYDLLPEDETPPKVSDDVREAVGEALEGLNESKNEETLEKVPETVLNAKNSEDNLEEVIDPLLRKAEELETELIKKESDLENNEDNLQGVMDPLLKKSEQLETELTKSDSEIKENLEDIIDPLLQMAQQLETELEEKSNSQDPSNVDSVQEDTKTDSVQATNQDSLEDPRSTENKSDETNLKLDRQDAKNRRPASGTLNQSDDEESSEEVEKIESEEESPVSWTTQDGSEDRPNENVKEVFEEESSEIDENAAMLKTPNSKGQGKDSTENSDETPLKEVLENEDGESTLREALEIKEEDEEDDDDSSLGRALKKEEDTPVRKTLDSREDKDNGEESRSRKALNKEKEDKYDNPLRKSLGSTDNNDEIPLGKTLESKEDDDEISSISQESREQDTPLSNKYLGGEEGETPLRKSSGNNEDKHDDDDNESPLRKTLESKENEEDENDDDSPLREALADNHDAPLGQSLKKEEMTEDEESALSKQGDKYDDPLGKSMGNTEDKKDETPLRKSLQSDDDDDDDDDDVDDDDVADDDTPLRKAMESTEVEQDGDASADNETTLENKEGGDYGDDDDDTPLRKTMESKEGGFYGDDETPLRKTMENKEDEDVGDVDDDDETPLRKTIENEGGDNGDADEIPLRKTMKKEDEQDDETPLRKTMENKEGDEIPLRKTMEDKESGDDDDEIHLRKTMKNEEEQDDDDNDETPLRKTMENKEDGGISEDDDDETPVKKTMENKESGDDDDEIPLRKTMKNEEGQDGDDNDENPLRKTMENKEGGDDGDEDEIPLRKTMKNEEEQDDDDNGETPLRKTIENKEDGVISEDDDESPLKKSTKNEDEEYGDDNDETPLRKTMVSNEDESDDGDDETPLRKTIENKESGDNGDEDEIPSRKTMKTEDEQDGDDNEETLLRATMESKEDESDDESPLREALENQTETEETLGAENPTEEAVSRPSSKTEDSNDRSTLKEPNSQTSASEEEETPLRESMKQKNQDAEKYSTTSSEEDKSEEKELEEARGDTPLKQATPNERENELNADNSEETSLRQANPEQDDIQNSEESKAQDQDKLKSADPTKGEQQEDGDETSEEVALNRIDGANTEVDGESLLKSAEDPEKEQTNGESFEKTNDETSLREDNPEAQSGEFTAAENLEEDTNNEDDEPSLKAAKPVDQDSTEDDDSVETLKASISNEVSEEDGETVRKTDPEGRNQEEVEKRLEDANPIKTGTEQERNSDDTQNSQETNPLRVSLNEDSGETNTEDDNGEEDLLRNASQENELDSNIPAILLNLARTTDEIQDAHNQADGTEDESKSIETLREDNSWAGEDPDSSGETQSSLPDLLKMGVPKSPGKLKVPKSIGQIMRDLGGREKDDVTSLQSLDPDKIDDIIGKIGEAEQQNLLEHSDVDCRKECACADDIDTRSRNIGRYEIVKDFLHWMKDLQLNRVLTDD